MIYSPAQACQILDCSTSTLRNYCDVAAAFLSDKAVPGEKKHRSFSEDDMRVLLVVKLARDYDDAKERLANGERVDLPTGNSEYFLSLGSADKIMLLENRILQLEAQVLELSAEKERRIRAEAERDLMRDLLREVLGKG